MEADLKGLKREAIQLARVDTSLGCWLNRREWGKGFRGGNSVGKEAKSKREDRRCQEKRGLGEGKESPFL